MKFTTLVILFLLTTFVFGQSDDEFISWDSLQTTQEGVSNVTPVTESPTEQSEIENSFELDGESLALIALSLTIFAAFFVQNRSGRKYRTFFLVFSLILFGFYASGCPCPICGVINVTLAAIGISEIHASGYWFFALIPITFVFGKTWCGWVCHLGALQELLFRRGKFSFLTSAKAQKVLSYIRYASFVILIIQVVITQSNLWKEIDPFRVAFSLIGTNTLSYILLVLLIISSIFVYRPFCRTICPLGLVLSWVSAIPGAMGIKQGSSQCGACKACSQACDYGVITRAENKSQCNAKECIMCGECIDGCKKNALSFQNRAH